MQFLVFATDFDGTLSHDGTVSVETIEALKRLADSGRRIVLVTGREMNSLKNTFPTLDYFHWIVAENGGVIFEPSSGSGKSTLANRIADVLTENAYQFCLVDPEGDFESFAGALVLGGPNSAPQLDEVMHALEQPTSNVVVCLTGIAIPDRPEFFLKLLGNLNQLRARTGRPHWLILDEAHHLMPVDWQPPAELLPNTWSNVVLITVNAASLPRAVLDRVSLLTIVGSDANETLQAFGAATNQLVPRLPLPPLATGEVWQWIVGNSALPIRFMAIKSAREHTRHRRKYAEGQLAPEKSFYFRGPDGNLNLRAQNLILFCQIAEGIDDETWLYHLKRNDFARWFRDCIKDDDLAAEAESAASGDISTATASKTQILESIQHNYVLMSTSRISVPGAM